MQMGYDDWAAVAAPKVAGTWNLHTAFADHSLDFFVLFSSISGLVGNPGQANYAAANTFLDSFVQFRHSNGLPASVIDIGAVGDVGYVSHKQAVMEQLRARMGYLLQEQDLLDSLELAIKRSQPQMKGHRDVCMNKSQLGIGFRTTQPISSSESRVLWRRDVRTSIYRNLEDTARASELDHSSASGTDSLKGFLAASATNPHMLTLESSAVVVARHIGVTLFGFMMRPIEELDLRMGPAALGMDSLVAIELRNWCRQRFGLDVSVLEIMGAASIEQLGSFVAQGLSARLTAEKD